MKTVRSKHSRPSSTRARVSALFASALLIATGLFALDVGDADVAQASHFRANQTNWVRTSADTVEFTLTNSWRASYYSGVDTPGDTFDDGFFYFGDGTSVEITWTAIAFDTVNDIVTAESVISHTYTTGGPFWAYQDNCCRLSSSDGHVNNSDGAIYMRTLVDLSQPGSLSSAISPIVGCPVDAVCNFTIPSSTPPSGTTKAYRMADAADQFYNQPPGASIDPDTGLYTWDTTGATVNPDPDPTFYSTQIVIETRNAAGDVVGSVSIDFFIQIGGTANNLAPYFVAPTPVDAAIITGYVAENLTFEVAADDDDDDHITLGMLNKPIDATFVQDVDNDGHAAADFAWTPTMADIGDHFVVLTAQDTQGLSATQRSVTLRIEPQRATTTLPPTTTPQTTPPTVPESTTTIPEVTTTIPEVTTTIPETTTTVPDATTTIAPSTTAAIDVTPQSTTPAPDPVQIEAASGGAELALTGSNTAALALVGFGLLIAGGVLVSLRRRTT